jgi:hypothetical protein
VRNLHDIPFGRYFCLCSNSKCVYRIWYFADRASQYIYLNINQFDALNFIMSLFRASTCFEHMCSSSGGQNCTIQSLVSSHLQVAGFSLQNEHHSKPAAPNLQHTTNWEQDDRWGNSTTQSQAPDDGYINVRNMLST